MNMRTFKILCCVATWLAITVLTRPLLAAELPPFTPATDARGEWSMTVDTALPNVLILGDSISMAYTRPVRGLLKNKANVFRAMKPGGKQSDNCGDTGIGLKNLEAWLGTNRWDVIHFNWGLWDLCYRNPESKNQGQRDKVNGKLTTTPEQYRVNLEQLVARLKKTGATLIWCSTTPVAEGEAGRKQGDDIAYNRIAEEVMKANGVLINDLHAHALLRLPGIQKGPGDVHFTETGSSYLAEKVAIEIAAVIGKNPARQP